MFGLAWIDDAAEILKAGGISQAIGANRGQKSKRHALAFGLEMKMTSVFLRSHHETTSFLRHEKPAPSSAPESSIVVEMRLMDDSVST